MALESSTFISGLVSTNPTGSDSISAGDDHLRLIKLCIKNSLPNAYEAINGIHTGSSAPSSTTAGLVWFDTSNNLIKIRNEANSDWINLMASEGDEAFKCDSCDSECFQHYKKRLVHGHRIYDHSQQDKLNKQSLCQRPVYAELLFKFCGRF